MLQHGGLRRVGGVLIVYTTILSLITAPSLRVTTPNLIALGLVGGGFEHPFIPTPTLIITMEETKKEWVTCKKCGRITNIYRMCSCEEEYFGEEEE